VNVIDRIILASCAFLLQTGVSLPQEAGNDSLTVRNAHAMIYNDDRATVMLFGGADEGQVLGDLWEWNGIKWRKLAATGPSPRTFPCMAYDRRRRRVVLFGGNRVLFGSENDIDTFLDDTWEWDGTRWHEIKTTAPSARAEACMVYDSRRRCMVLFGGYRRVEGKNSRLRDTWEWDGKTWKQVSTSGPSPRNGATMTYDSIRRRAILFGGNGPSGETWTWDGSSWSEVKPVVAEGRFNSAMAYDTTQRKVIRFGGWNGKERVADTWTFDGITWQRIDVAGPKARNHTAMAYDSKRRRVVLFGGHDGENVFGDTWEWDGEVWHRMAFTPARRRVDNGH
jgi:hypothetical protein